jgi:hypothetical protein
MSDRQQLEEAEARILFRTWEMTKEKVMTEQRKAWIKKIYGYGAFERIQAMMVRMHKGELV